MQEAAAATAPESTSRPFFSKSYRGWLLFVLALTNALNLADRQSLGASAQAIKLDLGLTDAQMGLVQGLAFAIFYSVLALPIARLAEHVSRTKIISAAVAIFGVMVTLCSKANNFWELLICRIGVGVGDAGFAPPVGSLIGDHYGSSRRASAMSLIWIGAPVGVVCGATLGGWMAEHVGWRAAFVAVGAPGIVVALLAFLTLREPPRGMSDSVNANGGADANTAIAAPSGPPPSMAQVLKFLLSKPSVRHLLAGCALAAISMNGIGQFFGQFIVRNYHVGLSEAGRILSLVAGVSMLTGMLLGGFGVDWAARRDKRWYAWGPSVTLLLASPAFILGFNQPTVMSAVTALMLGHVMLFVYWTPTLALAQNMVGASMRASSTFVFNFILGLVGIGLGPTLVGILSDRFARSAFTVGDFVASCPRGRPLTGALNAHLQACADASAIGLRHALMLMSLTFIWASIHYYYASRTLRRDLETRYVPPGGALDGAPAARAGV
jgi:predicted MFS family arabinose efflux permease